MADEFKGIGNEALRNVEALKSAMKDIASSTSKTNKALQDQEFLIADYASSFNKITSSANKFAELQDKAKRSASATSDAFKEQQKQLSAVRSLNAQIDNLYDKILTTSGAEEKILKKQVENLSAARDNAQELAKEFRDLVNDSSKLDKSTMWFSAISKVATDIPGLRKLAGPFEEAAKAARETVVSNAKNQAFLDEALETGKGLTKEKIKQLGLEKEAAGLTGKAAAARLKAAGAVAKTESVGIAGLQAGFKALGPIISGALGPLAIITTVISAIKALISAMFEADTRITVLSRNLQLTKEEARQLDEYFKAIKGDLETQYNLTKEIYQAQAELSTLTSTSVLYSKESLDAQIQLTKEYKLQAEDAANLNKFFLIGNKTATENLHIASKTTSEFFKRTGILFRERDILEKASKVSGQMLVSFKGSTAALMNAVMTAEKLGISLDKTKDISNSLLNFEDSISSELEAELLVGKDINLERARGLALQGKFAEAAEEAVKQVGTLEDFQRLNVIQQTALAKAAGLTADELSDALLQQRVIGTQQEAQYQRFKEADMDAYARKLAMGELSDKEIEDANKRLDAQEKFNLAIDKVKEVFTDLVDGGALDAIADAAMALADTIASGGSLFNFFGKSDLTKNLEKKSLETAKQTEKELTEKQKAGEELSKGEKERLEKAKARIKEDAEEKQEEEKRTETRQMNYGLSYEEQKAAEERIAKQKQTTKIPAKDFIIKTLEEDTVVAAGGTNLGRTDEMVTLLKDLTTAVKQELTMAVKQGGNVYLDLQKVGSTTDQGTYRLNS
jgi:hypothetical protein